MGADAVSVRGGGPVAPTADLDPHPSPAAAREARFQQLIRAWWVDERPGWTESDWWDVTIRGEVRDLLWVPAGPQLAAALAEIGRVDRCVAAHAGEVLGMGATPVPGSAAGFPCACMVVLAAAWEACAAWAAAGAACALVDAVGPQEVVVEVPELGVRVGDPAREELASALRVSVGSMANRIAGARDLIAHPVLVELVSTATLSAWAARLVLREVQDLDPGQASAVVDRVCATLAQRRGSGRRSWTSAEVGRAARRARLRVCPEADQKARVRAFAGRRVQVLPAGDGMATLVADLDATDAHRIHRRLSAIATGLADPADGRTRDQVRADALVDVLLGGADPASPGPGRPEISVVISAADLVGVSDNQAHVPGLGPIPADLARALAAEGTWRAWITDASGAVTATGTRGYVPSAAVARLVRAREPHCRMPGCRQPAPACDLDHTTAYPHGPTTVSNLGPLCRRHHLLKTHAGWGLEGGWDSEPGWDPGIGWDSEPGWDPEPACDPEPDNAHPAPTSTLDLTRSDPPEPLAWTWHTPAGFRIRDHATPPLDPDT